jgi:hypothetical protein
MGAFLFIKAEALPLAVAAGVIADPVDPFLLSLRWM